MGQAPHPTTPEEAELNLWLPELSGMKFPSATTQENKGAGWVLSTLNLRSFKDCIFS